MTINTQELTVLVPRAISLLNYSEVQLELVIVIYVHIENMFCDTSSWRRLRASCLPTVIDRVVVKRDWRNGTREEARDDLLVSRILSTSSGFFRWIANKMEAFWFYFNCSIVDNRYIVFFKNQVFLKETYYRQYYINFII